ncbi:uncharacterized protein LOC143215860 [Lasioglossum baleicum]|uniref:uncharacterized protein LOC143215860 n=1 Tax=Lasioglossum baleicum TaxID=434251 RepID=UPI003FCC3719
MSDNIVRKSAERNGSTRRRVSSAERELYLKPLLKLKQQEEVIERGLVTAIENMKIEPALLQDIVHTHRNLSMKREDFVKGLYRHMEDIASDLDFARNATKNPKEIKKLDVNTYRLKLFKLSQKIQDLTGSCSVRETLAQEQAALDDELRDFVPQLQKCEKLRRNALSSSQDRLEVRPEKSDHRDVQDFHVLVAKTGHTDNWSIEDHLFFLKTRQRCENVPALVAAIQKKCPDLSTEAIVNHEAWYKLYQTLREKQKIAVEEWRRKRELEKTRSMEETDRIVDDPLVEDDDPKENDKNDETTMQKTIQLAKSVSTRSSSSAESNNGEKKELIRKWRMEKENKIRMDEEQLRLRVKLKREMEENERRRKKERIRGALEEYRKKKALESESRESSASSKEKFDSALIKAFREQDKEYAKRRKDRILRNQRLTKMELPTTRMSDFLKVRDFSTLLDSTAVWRERCKSSERLPNEPQFIKDVPRMCVRWRNEESADLRN